MTNYNYENFIPLISNNTEFNWDSTSAVHACQCASVFYNDNSAVICCEKVASLFGETFIITFIKNWLKL